MNRFSAFSLGVVLTAVSVGAVNYVSATGDVVIKACANKSTGAMRYISKGSCKKSERTLQWNQMGPQGQNGATGASGQNLFVVDANGQVMGRHLGGSGGWIEFLRENRQWVVNPYHYELSSLYPDIQNYSDAQCLQRLLKVSKYELVPQDIVFIEMRTQQVFVPANSTKLQTSDFSALYKKFGNTCLAMTDLEKTNLDTSDSLVNAVQINLPTYVAPLTIQER